MRTRDLKPDFWTDEKVVQVSDGAKLLFQGLWNLADREGRLEDKPVSIGFKVRPWDAKATPKLLTELAEAGLIVRYEADGVKCIGIPGLTTHQRIHPKEMASKLPDWRGLEVSREKVELFTAGRGKNENSVSQSGSSGPSGPSEPAGPSGPSVAEPATLMPGPADLAHAWNTDTSPPLPRVTLPLAKGRTEAAKAALQRRSLPEWRRVFQRINTSSFLRGADGGWKADFDWAIRPEGKKPEPATRVLEGAYDRAAPPGRDQPAEYTEGYVT